MYNQLISLGLLITILPVSAELAQLSEDDLGGVSGQAGITISARADFDDGTKVAFSNENIPQTDYDQNGNYIGSGATWIVFDDISGSIEVKNLDIDLIDGVGPNEDKGAIQLTLPEYIDVNELKTKGVYLGNGPEVAYDSADNSTSHLFLIGLEIDGRLTLPAATKVNIFPVEQ